VAWPRGVKDTLKLFSSLTVFLYTPEQANQMIARGFAKREEVKIVERFYTECGLVQCFKCYSYGHIAKSCRLAASCGHCAQEHKTKDCSRKETVIYICYKRTKKTKTVYKV